MATAEMLCNRLENWKFRQAENYLIGNKQALDLLTAQDVEVIRALARLFENSGWFDGDVSKLVEYIVGLLCEKLKKKGET